MKQQYTRAQERGAGLDPPAEVDPHGQVPVAAVRVEAVVSEGELDQGDVGRVHALQGDAGRADVPAGFRDQVLQGVQHLLQDRTLDQASFKHGVCRWWFSFSG